MTLAVSAKFSPGLTRIMTIEREAADHFAVSLSGLPRARAERVARRFRIATPVLTGTASMGWMVSQVGPFTFAVVNEVRNLRSDFPYPAALITGTGSRGLPTPGFEEPFSERVSSFVGPSMFHEFFALGSTHRMSTLDGATRQTGPNAWLGMAPNPQLRAAWLDEARREFVIPALATF